MEARAVTKYLKVQPRKVRIVADEIRGKSAVYAAAALRYHTSKSAALLRKTLMSAVANAIETKGMEGERLRVAAIEVNDGPIQKRMRARAQGRGNRINKKTAHITVVLDDNFEAPVVKKGPSKAKPRPTLAVKAGAGKKPAAAKASKAKAAPVEEEAKTEVVAEEPVVETPAVEETSTESAGEGTE